MTQYVYLFRDADGKNKAKFGGKGANLAEMTKLGMPVPPGFTITTEACTKYYDDGEQIAPEIIEEVFKNLEILEKETGKKFGDYDNPFLVSVRSDARHDGHYFEPGIERRQRRRLGKAYRKPQIRL